MNSFNWDKLGIDVSRIRREGKTICPKCGPTRKNKRDKSLSVNVLTGVYCCHNTPCDFSGCADDSFLAERRPRKEYVRPLPKSQPVSDAQARWFESRGISNGTLLYMKVTQAEDEWMPQDEKKYNCICFNYYRDQELISIKYRTGNKLFKLSKDSELIFYNINCLREKKVQYVIIVEGEMDVLTVVECGLYKVISVPNGANQLKPGQTPKLEYIENCWAELQNAECYIIATDDDEAGNILKRELIRRLGSEKCYTVTYPAGCKDVNEVLMKHDRQAVLDMFKSENLSEIPLDGVMTMEDLEEEADLIYNHGYPETAKLGWELDKWITWLRGDQTVLTGIPNHGKSTVLNNILCVLAEKEKWVIGIFGPEKMRGGFLVAELAAIWSGYPTYKADPTQKIAPEKWKAAKQFIAEHFLFIKTEGIDMTLDGLLAVGDRLVRRYGIDALVLDPWNYVETDIPAGETETVWLGKQLGKTGQWAKSRNAHLFIVAHPTKMPKDQKTKKLLVPSLYDISGSAHWNNKIDNGLCVYRDYSTGLTEIYIHKVRWFFVGRGGGKVTMTFHTECQQFRDYVPPTQEQQSYEDIVANQKLRERGREMLEQKPLTFGPAPVAVTDEPLPF